MILTASRKPDSVGELSMRASNTSSEFVLTYRRTNINQEKTFFNTKEDTFFQFWFNLDFFMRLACFYLPLCASSLRACLLVGELVCSLSGYSLFRELLEAQTFALDKSGHLASVWKCWLWWLNVMFFCACVCVTMLTFPLRPWEWPIETGKPRGDQRSD